MINAQQRQAVLATSVEMTQQISSVAYDPTTLSGAINIPLRNVGLVKKLIVVVSGNVINSDAANDSVVSPFGFANVISNFTFTDLNNNLRINTTGWHINMLNSCRDRWPYASALEAAAWTDTTTKITSQAQYGANFAATKALNKITHGAGALPFKVYYEIPLAYSDDDLRGAVYANVVNAVMNMGITINPNASAFVGAAADDTNAIASNGTTVYSGNVTITVYQVYLDQLPTAKGQVILPILDLSTVYELKNTKFTGMTVSADFPVPYANFRDFLSTFAVYNSTGGNAGQSIGTDINTWALQSANFTNIFKIDPFTAAVNARRVIGTDLPKGAYYFSHRRKPLSTTQYGNMELVLNPSTATAGSAYLLVGWEDFALVNTLTQAGSLAG